MKFEFWGRRARELAEQIRIANNQAEHAANYVREIQKGNFNAPMDSILGGTNLGASLDAIREHLKTIAQTEKERNWMNEGIAIFADVLRNQNGLPLKELADNILSQLVKYVDANQGSLFILDDTTKGDEYLELLACYAYDRKKFVERRIGVGQGLVGQCVLERAPIYMTQVPANYVTITSGLGQATPRAILISPLLINEKIFGVLELASFHPFEKNKIDFISRICENIAATVRNIRENDRVRLLLASSQEQSEELRAQEEEMRQNMEELQATQEEMQRKSDEVSRGAAEMQGMLQGINATMATIEFTPDGIVLDANSNFLRATSYTLPVIQGKHHRQFVAEEDVNSKEYQHFWNRLSSGDSITGIFKRVDSKGKYIWLNAIYNPIRDAKGNVIKVVKFATDITAQQEALAESKSIMKGINSTMSVIEFQPNGLIINANENFLTAMGYQIDEIRGKHHKMFVPEDVLNSDDYKQFWNRLAAGESFTGIFKRKTRTGDAIMLNAIYNPILGANGTVTKVVKFATEAVKEMVGG